MMDLTKQNKQLQKRKTNLDLGTMVYGKVPPQAKDLEEAVLGAIMLERDAFDRAFEYLRPEFFYVESHQRIFQAMIDLTLKSNPVEILTVVEELRRKEEIEIVGGPYYVTKLTNNVVSSSSMEFHCKIISEKYIQREMIRIGGEMIGDAYEDTTDAFELLDNVEQKIFDATQAFHKSSFKSTDSLIVNAIQKLEKIRGQPQGSISGVSSGFLSMDRITHGWQNTDLIILAARPAVGKTAFALNLARNAARDPIKPVPVALFSLEMSSGQLIERLLSSESEIALEKISRGTLDDQEHKLLYARGIQKLAGIPLYIDDTPALNIFELRAKARRMKSKFGIGLVIVDYLQLMSGTGNNKNQNREQEISTISRGLKALAKDLKVPIIALSQLSRETEKRADKMPQLSDLRESGAIEQDADAVVFMYRPEYYTITRDDMGESNPGETHFKFAKYRNGAPGMVKLRAHLWIQKFTELETTFLLPSSSEGWKPVSEERGAKLFDVGNEIGKIDPEAKDPF